MGLTVKDGGQDVLESGRHRRLLEEEYSPSQRYSCLPSSLPAHHIHRFQHSFPNKNGWRLRQKPRFPANNASGGPGMQAVFLDSGRRSCGTGFFLPRSGDNHIHFYPTKNPACSPVLVPCRVVKALNLNVHDLGSQLTPQRGHLRVEDRVENGVENHSDLCGDNKSGKNNVVESSISLHLSRTNSPPEIFLPKDWSY